MKTVTVRKMEGGFMGLVFKVYKFCNGLKTLAGYTTYWHTIYLSEARFDDRVLLAHELTHVQQIEQLGIVKFGYQYLKESIKKGYRENRFEVEARLNAKTKTEEMIAKYKIVKK